MGKKKTKRTRMKRKVSQHLTNRFDCPKCNHEKVVTCRVNRSHLVGLAVCSACEAVFKCSITKLDQGIDVYHKWVDEN